MEFPSNKQIYHMLRGKSNERIPGTREEEGGLFIGRLLQGGHI